MASPLTFGLSRTAGLCDGTRCQCRLVAAAEAYAAGYGGITAVATATGMAPSTIGRGLKELGEEKASGRVRRPGAGRKPAIAKRCYGASGEGKASSSL
jgi:hypothetical protein